MVHDVFRRAWLLAFGNEAAPGAAGGDRDDAGLEDFATMMGRRVKKASDFMRCHAELEATVCIALLTEPMDELTLRLLNLDSEGRLMMDVCGARAHMDPIAVCQEKLCSELRPDPIVLELLVSEFKLVAERQASLFGTVRRSLSSCRPLCISGCSATSTGGLSSW